MSEGLSISAFCERVGLTRREWRLLQEIGQAPVVRQVGRRQVISVAEADQWQRVQAEIFAANLRRPPVVV